jgi:hypothetical protein
LKIPGRCALALLFAATTGVVHAQASNLDISLGLKAWNAQWTTFGYSDDGSQIIQVPAKDKVVLIPLLSVRYQDFIGSISGFVPTDFELEGGTINKRKELDLNVGWLFAPGVAATLGYKRLGQAGDGNNYELHGPTIGLSATAPIRGGISIYGTLGLGRLKSTSGSNVKFDADYQLSELGLAYSLPLSGIPRALTFTAGYRIQILTSKEALGSQDARDLTQGFTLGALARF